MDQGGQVMAMQQQALALGRALLPEEVADCKARGREWGRLYRDRPRKNLSEAQMEERKEKNRQRQKRFRDKQKTKEAEEERRLAQLASQQSPHQAQALSEQEEQHAQPVYSDQAQTGGMASMGYAAQQQPVQADSQEGAQHAQELALLDSQAFPQREETLTEKRKRLGRERQARFREKKRARVTGGDIVPEVQPSVMTAPSQHPEGAPVAEMQKIGAQLAGYYAGLTQGYSVEDQNHIIRYFLDGLREDLGEEIFGGVASYVFEVTQAAVHVHAQYMQSIPHQAQIAPGLHQGLAQGIDMQQAIQAAAAAAQMPHGELPAHLHPSQIHMPPHMEQHQPGAPGADMAQFEYQRQLAEHHANLAHQQAQQPPGMLPQDAGAQGAQPKAEEPAGVSQQHDDSAHYLEGAQPAHQSDGQAAGLQPHGAGAFQKLPQGAQGEVHHHAQHAQQQGYSEQAQHQGYRGQPQHHSPEGDPQAGQQTPEVSPEPMHNQQMTYVESSDPDGGALQYRQPAPPG